MQMGKDFIPNETNDKKMTAAIASPVYK